MCRRSTEAGATVKGANFLVKRRKEAYGYPPYSHRQRNGCGSPSRGSLKGGAGRWLLSVRTSACPRVIGKERRDAQTTRSKDPTTLRSVRGLEYPFLHGLFLWMLAQKSLYSLLNTADGRHEHHRSKRRGAMPRIVVPRPALSALLCLVPS